MSATRLLAVMGVLLLGLLGACSYLPKTDNSIDASGSEVKSTATIRTNTIQRPLE
ncbi:MAG: hypothetical protein H7X92_12765 [Chitinophagales bacterium]|nr:hypothetical protein [Hyphomicrobiales bacterium]